MTEVQFLHTKNALVQLENQLKCSICGVFASSPVTLGGCEHLFCNVCCGDYLGTCCPVCDIPAHVKDADIDRQLYNLARLCQKLTTVLHRSSNTLKHGHSTPDGIDDLEKQKTQGQTSKGHKEKRVAMVTETPNHAQKTSHGTTETKDSKTVSGRSSRRRSNKPAHENSLSHENDKGANSSLQDDQHQSSLETSRRTKKGRVNRRTRSLDPKETKIIETSLSDTAGTALMSHDISCDAQDDDTVVKATDTNSKTGSKIPRSRKRKSVETSGGGRKTRLRHSVGGHETDANKLDSGSRSDTESFSIAARSDQVSSTAVKERKRGTHSARGSNVGDDRPSKQALDQKVAKPLKSAEDGASTATPSKPTCSPRAGKQNIQQKSLSIASPAAGPKSRGMVPASDKRNAKGETALQVAAIKNDIEKVRSLLAAGANPNVRDNAGWSPLHEACHHGYVEVATLLLDGGALINVPGLDNDTALHDAVSNHQLQCVRLLVSRGASLTLRNMSGQTATDLAVTDAMQQALATPVLAPADYKHSQPLDVLEYQAPCLLGTGLSREEKVMLLKVCRKLKVKQADEVTPEVTHIVTRCNAEGMCPRTIKLLHGVLQGKWIVTVDWLATCDEVGSLVCEEAFEVQGTSLSPNSQCPYKGRINSRQQLPGLFNGCQFYFHGSFEYATPAKEDLVALIKAGDGQILVREPKPSHLNDLKLTVPYHVDSESDLANCGIFIVHEKQIKFEPIRMKHMCSVSSSWILDCVAYFKLLPLPAEV